MYGEHWEYYVKDADRAPVTRKPVCEITFLDPAQGSGHFHLEAFDLFYAMYEEEAARQGSSVTPREIAAAILNHNLFGIDIDGRSVQIATAALWMKAKERAQDLAAADLITFHDHLVATNIRLPKERNHLELFLQKHPEDAPLRPALELVFKGLEHADELGALLQIEELVDALLRRLKEEGDKNKGTSVQTGLFEPTLVQATLPVSVEDYDKWKRDALDRLQTHFEAEAQAADAVQAFFSESAGKGLSFFILLSRRYDVVVANPPYMGSKNLGEDVKKYIEVYFKAGKRDLYAAFVLQCIKLAAVGGSVAMVTMNKWLHARAYSPLRCGRELSATGSEKGERASLNILFSNRLRSLVDLGSRAFDPENKFHDGVQVALFVLGKAPPEEDSAVAIVDCTAPRDPEGKNRALKSHLAAEAVARTLQSRFINLPGSPLCYKLSDELLGKISQATRLGLLARIRQGICTTHDPRFVRMFWETALGTRWKVFAKGGGHKRWDGLRHFAVDWDYDGRRIKEFITDTPHAIHWSGRMPESDYYFKEGWCFSRIAFGSLGVRKFRKTDLFGHTNPVILFNSEIAHDEVMADVGLLNSSLTTFLLRAITQSNDFHEGYLRRLPWPRLEPKLVPFASEVAKAILECAAELTSAHFTEVTFGSLAPHAGSFVDSARHRLLFTLAKEFVVCAGEAVFQRLAYRQWALSASDIELVERSMGAVEVPPHSDSLPPESSFLNRIADLQLGQVAPGNSAQSGERESLAKDYIQGVHETEPTVADEDSFSDEAEDDDKDSTTLPMPPFGDVDAFSRFAGINFAESYLTLRSAISAGALGDSRLTAEACNLVTGIALRLLGHRWPKQIEANEALPTWVDLSGIIPLTSGGGEAPLVERVRQRLAAEFTNGNLAALEREFEQIVGLKLEHWLASSFFERHITQFKRRPIVWQIESQVRIRASGTRRRGVRPSPRFSCVLYYHKLDVGLLPKLRTHYAGVLRSGYETQLRTLERLPNASAEQQGRKLQLEEWVEELKAFDHTLERVSTDSFGPEPLRPTLRQYAINDTLLNLTAYWLRKLNDVVIAGPLASWEEAGDETALHEELPAWVREAFQHLDYFCAVVGPKPPKQDTFVSDPTTKELAPLVCAEPAATVSRVLSLACDRWWEKFDRIVLVPLKLELKQAREEQKRVKEELNLDEVRHDYARHTQLADRRDELKERIQELSDSLDAKNSLAENLRSDIEGWNCPDAATWESWLVTQPLFDTVASMDGERPAPQTIADFIAQESAYAPDINDGVRVNIAPLQKAGLLHADVLDPKDVDKAIADRAEWRADERRWVREGKLPQPGWWETRNSTT